jgi:predicted PurR-regulated permease PerM
MSMADGDLRDSSDTRFVRRLLILVGIAVVVVIAFVLRDLLILIFGSIIVAVILTAMTNPIQRWTKLRRGFALAIAICVLLGVVAGAGALFGTGIANQAQQLGELVPAGWRDGGFSFPSRAAAGPRRRPARPRSSPGEADSRAANKAMPASVSSAEACSGRSAAS